jgi:hypothetical protein
LESLTWGPQWCQVVTNAVWLSLATSKCQVTSEALQVVPQILYCPHVALASLALHLVNTCGQKQGGFSDSLCRRRAP